MQVGTDPTTLWKARDCAKMLTTVEDWATRVAERANRPDLWALGTGTLPEAVDNSPFWQPERDEIAKRLDEIHDYVQKQFELAGEQLAALTEAVNELRTRAHSAGRTGR